MHLHKYPTLQLPQGTLHSHPDHDHPYGTPRLKDPQSPQIPADAAEYSFQSSTCKFAQPKKSCNLCKK